MSVENLDKIFRPDSIAVIGAGERPGSIGAALMRNLIQGGFAGEIYPINPKHGVIMKMPAYPSVKDIKAPVDLGIIATPITSAPQIVKECAEADVGGVVIISAGGKEIGEAGKNVEAAIQKATSHTGALAGEDADYDAAFKRADILPKHGVCQQRSWGKSYTKLDSYLYLNL